MSTVPLEDASSSEHEPMRVITAEDLQFAPLVAKLNEWNLTYTIDPDFPIAKVQKEEETQVRDVVHIAPRERVDEYVQQMRNGAKFPPVLVRTPGYALIDGNTRLAAAKRVGRKTFPTILVDTKTPEMAKILAAALNQMGGERLSPSEAHEAALLMMQLGYPDSAVSRELGRDVSQVRRWRNQRDVYERAERLGLAEQVQEDRISRSVLGTLAAVTHDEPFTELVKLFADVRPSQGESKEMVTKVLQANSDESALRLIAEVRDELAPAGPPPHAVTRTKIGIVRAAIGNLLKLSGHPAAAFNPAKRDEEIERWQRLRQVVDEVLAALNELDHA